MSSLGPASPPLFCSPGLSGWEGKQEKASSLGRGQQGAAGESLSGQTLEERPLVWGQENGCPCTPHPHSPCSPRAAPHAPA